MTRSEEHAQRAEAELAESTKGRKLQPQKSMMHTTAAAAHATLALYYQQRGE